MYQERINLATTEAHMNYENINDTEAILNSIKDILQLDTEFEGASIIGPISLEKGKGLIVTTKEKYVYYVYEKSNEYKGTTEEVGDININVELTDEDIEYIYTPSGWTNGNVNVKIKVNKEEYQSYNIECSIDGNSWNPYIDDGITITENNTTIYTRLRNGNLIVAAQSGFVSNIDKEKPVVDTVYSEGTSVTFTASDGLSGIYSYFIHENDLLATAWVATPIDPCQKTYTHTFNNLKPNTRYCVGVTDLVGNYSKDKYVTTPGDVLHYIDDNEWDYTIDWDGAAIILTKYKGTNTDVMVYATYQFNGVTLKTLINSDTAFKNNTTIKNVELEENTLFSAHSMKGAFYGCTYLESVSHIPDNTTDMRYAFENCYSLKYVPIIPENVLRLDYAFYNAEAITGDITILSRSVNTSTNIVNPGYYWYYKKELYINVPSTDSKTYGSFSWIGEEYKNYVIIQAPPEIDSSEWAYSVNESDKTITLNAYNGNETNVTIFDKYKINDDIYSTIVASSGKPMFYQNTTLETLKIYPNVTIENNNMTAMCYGCSSLKTVISLPATVTNMVETFKGCTSLINVPEIPSSVTSLAGTFERCSSLINAPTIPSSVTSLAGTFYYCSSLTGTLTIQSNDIANADNIVTGTYGFYNPSETSKFVTIITPGTDTTTYTTIQNQNSSYIGKYFYLQ